VLLAAGLSGAVAHTFLPLAPATLVYLAVGVLGVAALVVGVRRQRLEPAGPWWLIAAGLALSITGDLIWYGYSLLLHSEPFPSLADLVYLLAYPAHAFGLAWLIRLRHGDTDRAAAIDAAIVTVGAGVLSWVYLVTPAAADSSLPLLARLIAGAYPVADLLIVAVFVRLLFTPGGASPAFGLLGLSFAAMLAGDVLFGVTTLIDLSALTRISDTLYACAYPLAAAAVLHPSVNHIVLTAAPQRATLTRWRLLLLGSAALFAPGLLAVQTLTHQSISGLAIATGSAMVFLLVVVRMMQIDPRGGSARGAGRAHGALRSAHRHHQPSRLGRTAGHRTGACPTQPGTAVGGPAGS
jgi:diguanylate cyclase